MPAYDNRSYKCHRDCISTYTSKLHVCRDTGGLPRNTEESSSQSRSLRSQSIEFNINLQCLFCGEECKKLDKRHPNRKKKEVAKVSDFNTKNHTFKDTLLKLCEHHTDDWSNTVKFRVLSVISDLSAAGVLYYRLCYIKFKTFSVKEKKSNDCNL